MLKLDCVLFVCRLSSGRSFQWSGAPSGWTESGLGDGAGETRGLLRLLQRRLQQPTLPQPATLHRPVEEAPVQVNHDVPQIDFILRVTITHQMHSGLQ